MPKRARVGGAGLFAASHHAVLTRSQAASLGLSQSQIRSLKALEVIAEPVSRVLVFAGCPATWHQRMAMATVDHGYSVVASHRSAARLHAIDGFQSVDDIEVSVPRGIKVRQPGVIRHQVGDPLLSCDVIVVEGIPTTSWARTIVDVADTHDGETVERAIDDFERKGKSLIWLQLTAQRAKRRRLRGAGVVLASIEHRRVRRGRVRGSWFERLVELCLQSPVIGPISLQHELRDEDGAVIGYLDLAIPELRIGIEGHSRSFHTGEVREAIDERRDNLAALVGWDIRYIGYTDATRTPKQVLRFIERLVARRRADLGLDAA